MTDGPDKRQVAGMLGMGFLRQETGRNGGYGHLVGFLGRWAIICRLICRCSFHCVRSNSDQKVHGAVQHCCVFALAVCMCVRVCACVCPCVRNIPEEPVLFQQSNNIVCLSDAWAQITVSDANMRCNWLWETKLQPSLVHLSLLRT